MVHSDDNSPVNANKSLSNPTANTNDSTANAGTADHTTSELRSLVANLIEHNRFDAKPGDVDQVETHISIVVLTRHFAFKFKKRLSLPFLDFSSLASRRKYCREELRLNRRWAPDLYLEVVRIVSDGNAYYLLGDDVADRNEKGYYTVDYAVKMRRFDHHAELSHQVTKGNVDRNTIELLARTVGEMHADAAVAPKATSYATPTSIKADLDGCFEALQLAPEYLLPPRVLNDLRNHAHQCYAALTLNFTDRRENGFVRECHGDLHLANVAIIDAKPVPFDGIEFSEDLRWIDVMNEIAFVCMDLERLGRFDLANVFVNAYLECTGDYAGLALLNYYKLYRVLVRTKVASLRVGQCSPSTPDFQNSTQMLHQHVALANDYLRFTTKPGLIITHGYSGSGKTWLSGKLLSGRDVIRVRSDTERIRHYHNGEGSPQIRYSSQATETTYAALASMAEQVIAAGYAVIVDATFLRYEKRLMFRKLATRLQVPFHILSASCDVDTLKSRVTARQCEGIDASEATVEVLENQIADADRLTENELDVTYTVNTGASRAGTNADSNQHDIDLSAIQRKIFPESRYNKQV